MPIASASLAPQPAAGVRRSSSCLEPQPPAGACRISPCPEPWALACAVAQRQAAPPRSTPRLPTPARPASAREVMRAEDRLWLTRPGAQVVHWVAQLADVLEPAALASHIDARRQQLPHFGQRITRTERGAPCWEAVPQWSARDHVRSLRLEAGPEALSQEIERQGQAPLPPGRPPWEIVLLQQPGQGTVMVFRGHHAMGDGRSGVEALLALHDDPAEAQASRARLAPARKYQGTPNGPLIDGAQAIGDTFGTMTRLLMGRPERNAQLKGAGKRVAETPRRHAWLGPWPVPEVKAAAHAFGGTVNDLLLTTIAGGVRRYLQARGERPEKACLNALQIVAVPRKADQRGGNAVTAVSTPLPVQPGDLATRFAAVRSIMRDVKTSWRPEMMRNAQRLALTLPPALQRGLYQRSADQHSAIVSNIQGCDIPLRVAGHAITGMRWFGPAFGSVSLQLSALSYAGQFTLGVSTNPAIVQDAPALEAAIAAAYAEIVAAAKGRQTHSK